MGQILVVANQTLGGAQLDHAVRERIERGTTRFFVLVPMTPAAHEAATWSGGFAVGRSLSHPYVVGPFEGLPPEQAARQVEEQARRREAGLDDARQRARERLRKMIDAIVTAGGQAEGDVGDTDPVVAVEAVVQDRKFDEIIVSTLPAGISRWLRMDLSSRLARMTDAPVTTVEARE